MFTGLIETTGTLKAITPHDGGAAITVVCTPWSSPLVLGESIAVQGACLTVTYFDDSSFRADMLDETLRRTNLSEKRAGQFLNLERSLRLGDRMGGHFVTGHVDALGTLEAIRMEGRDRILRIRCGRQPAAGIVEKGSVALDGISLTVSSLDDSAFEVSIIPWTWAHTSLHERVVGDSLNIETDMIGKYIQRHLATQTVGMLSEDMLVAAGFIGND